MNIADVAVSLLKVIVVGLLLGAGLPAVFALGLRAVSRTIEVPNPDAPGEVLTRVSRPSLLVGYLCFAIVGLAVFAGIAWIVIS